MDSIQQDDFEIVKSMLADDFQGNGFIPESIDVEDWKENGEELMINLNVSTMIYRPIRQVFDFVSAPENDFQWQYGTLTSARLSEGTSAIGTLFRSISHLMGRRIESTFEVTEYALNKKYGFKSLSGPLHSQTSYTFEIANGSTKVTVSTQANLVNLFQVGDGILEKAMKKQLKEDLAMLKVILEAKKIL